MLPVAGWRGRIGRGGGGPAGGVGVGSVKEFEQGKAKRKTLGDENEAFHRSREGETW